MSVVARPNENDMLISPEPGAKVFSVAVNLNEPADIVAEILDMQGKTILIRSVRGKEGINVLEFNKEGMYPETYTLSVTSRNRNIITRKIKL